MATAKFKIESGAQLLARLTKKTEIENYYSTLFDGGLKQGQTVEIFSSINTSHLLIDIIIEALYPSKPNEESVAVLMFNTIGQLNYEELIQSLRKRICLGLDINQDLQISEIDVERKTHQALSNFFLLEIYDATQFYTTIQNLDSIFNSHPNISLLIFDNITAFYWSEQGFKINKMDLYIKYLIRMIQKVCKDYKLILLYTRPEYFSSSKDLETGEIIEGVNFKVQLVSNGKGLYQANVKTLNSSYKKYFNIIDNLIKWQ